MSGTSFKLVLLGEGRVGKTSLISRYTQNTFNDKEQSTVQANMYAQASVPLLGRRVVPGATEGPDGASVSVPSSSPSSAHGSVSVAIWDTAGQERYHALAPIYYRNADGAMLVFDICDKTTLERVRTWTHELRAVAGDHIELVMCGNKVDQPASQHEVTAAEANALAQELGAALVWTSAKTGKNVGQAFSTLATVVVQAAKEAAGGGSGRQDVGGSPRQFSGRPASRTPMTGVTPPRPRRGQLVVVEDEDAAWTGSAAPVPRGPTARDTPQRVNLTGTDNSTDIGDSTDCC